MLPDNEHRIEKENPFCDAAPGLFGAMPIEEARRKYPELFPKDQEWRLPTNGEPTTDWRAQQVSQFP